MITAIRPSVEPLSGENRRPHLLGRLGLVALIFCIAEGLIFHTSFYPSIAEPGSTAGTLYWRLQNEENRQRSGKKDILAIGDSRMAFRPRIANEGNSAMAYSFATIATPGTTPRCWYYMLREIDPRARRYSAIILPVDDYDDEDWEDIAGRVSDLYYLLPILRVSDLREFSMSYPANAARWEAFRGGLLKGWSYRRDFQDLLVNHERRMLEVNWTRTESAKSFYNFVWTTNSLKGMSVDWAARKISYPPDTTEEQRRVLNNVLLRGTAPQVGYLAAYRRKWFGKIVEHYRGSHTRLIFLRLPRGPVVRPYPVVKKSGSIHEFASHPQVALLDEHLFDELEHPELFVDSLHMNGPGSARFSEVLAAEVARILGR